MTLSSGVNAGTLTTELDCLAELDDDVCEFAGVVDVYVDPDVCIAIWDCPKCGQPRELAWADVLENHY